MTTADARPALAGGDAPPPSRARPFRAPARGVAGAVVASAGSVAALVAAVLPFDGTLEFGGAGRLGARAAMAAAVAGSLVGLGHAVRAVLAVRHADRLARGGDVPAARARAQDAKDECWWVLGIGLATMVTAGLFITFAADHGGLRTLFFNWSHLDGHYDELVKGFWLNIKIFTVTEVIVLVWALLVAVVRMLPGRACAPVRWLATAYTDLFRGIPVILVIYVIVLGLPKVHLPVLSSLGREQQLFWLAVFSLTLTYGAYVSEVYRAGIDSIHWSQTAAARSLGLSQVQTLRHVVFPQAVRRVIPPLLNDFISLQKDTALVSVVGLLDILNRATILKGQDFNFTYFAGAAIAFVVITIPLTRFTDWLIVRDQRRTQAGRS